MFEDLKAIFKSFVFAVIFLVIASILTSGDQSMPVGNIILVSLLVWWLDYKFSKIQTFINNINKK